MSNDHVIRNGDKKWALRNENISHGKRDVLYHLCLDTETHDLVKMFGDVKFVCMGGTAKRMENFAKHCLASLNDKLPPDTSFIDFKEFSYRYSMYKVGPILAVSHGIGVPSFTVVFHELVKLMHHANVKDPIFIRIGTSGGIGVEPGTVVVSNGAFNELIAPFYEQIVCGKKIRRAAKLDQNLAREIQSVSRNDDGFKTILGKTMCAMDFYEGQARLDGAICEYTEDDKMDYLKRLHEAGVRNIEMEVVAFAALSHHLGVRAADICVTLLNRLHGDQICIPKEVLTKFESRPLVIVARFIETLL